MDSTDQENLRRINSTPPDQWQPLFDLIPELEEALPAGKNFTAQNGQEVWGWTTQTSHFYTVIGSSPALIIFKWMVWSEGILFLETENPDFSNFDLLTLCKFVTLIIRAERFCEGYFLEHLENGDVLKILCAIRQKVELMSLTGGFL